MITSSIQEVFGLRGKDDCVINTGSIRPGAKMTIVFVTIVYSCYVHLCVML